MADFYLVSKRTLDPFEWKVFRYHFLLGADWKLCARQVKIDRGNFFHAVYRIEQKLGRVFRELKPYALFPVDEYFQGRTVNEFSVLKESLLAFRPGSLAQQLNVPVRLAA